ncbi:hypothetical protein [Cryobacterium sp. Y82]|uniref:hypothetical protein n=1 Tax=Cryobacterium sp. Y82 TaxID=2045017 RepID=UPI0011AFD47F|nr:hypothetical protein [Cryobacterium sp. Y82]
MSENSVRTEMVRKVLAGASLCVPVLVVIISWRVWRGDLPTELASHWSGSGPADDAMAVGTLLALNLGMTGVPAVAGVAISVWPGMSARAKRGAYFFLGVFGGMGAAIWLLSAGLTMQVGDPYEVVLGAWVIVSFVAAGYGIIPFLIAPRPRLEATDVQRRIEFAPSAIGAWSQTISGNLFLWVAIGLIILGSVIYGPAVVAGRASDQIVGIAVIAVTIVLVASFVRLRVTADWRGLRVVSAIFRIPLRRIHLEAIAVVEAAELRPAEWGGWGYRIMPGRSAVILRKGPGLIVTTKNEKQFAISLDDPETPAALLATLRDDNAAAPEMPRESKR